MGRLMFDFSPETRPTRQELCLSIDWRFLPRCPEHAPELAYLCPEFSTPIIVEGDRVKFRFTCTGRPRHYRWIAIGGFDSGAVVYSPEFTWLKTFLADNGLTL